MGCGSSADVMKRIKEQEKKIDGLIEMSKNLEEKVNEINGNNPSENKNNNETNDVTNLKTTIDHRFTKLEKTVEKIHNEFKVKLFEGISDKPKNGKENNSRQHSLTLNFDKENPAKGTPKPKKDGDVHWNDLLHDSHMTPQRLTMDKFTNFDENVGSRNTHNKIPSKNIVDHNEIEMNF